MHTTESLWKKLATSSELFLIAGPCVIESRGLCLEVATHLREVCHRIGITLVFKASFDKANRTSAKSYRGPGLEEGLDILASVKESLNLPILTDVHAENQCEPAARVADILQIPAFLCRQTDLIHTACATGRIVNLKKGQFLSPAEMIQAARKAAETGNQRLLLTERGTTFGYNNLVVDMRAIPQLQSSGFPVIFDATHSVQIPGGGGDKSSGQRQFAPTLARAAVAAGANGLFIETHPTPDTALSDGPNMIPLQELNELLLQLVSIHRIMHPTPNRNSMPG